MSKILEVVGVCTEHHDLVEPVVAHSWHVTGRHSHYEDLIR
jgi:hypothetical protein